VVLLLDIATIGFSVFAVKKVMQEQSFFSISFLIMMIIVIIIAILISKEAVSHGAKFGENSVEFTGLDDNNIFEYNKIVKIHTHKDNSVSFVKNFLDRHSQIVIYLDDESVVTVDLGLTTKKALSKIEALFIEKCPNVTSISNIKAN
jgi:hypothetical protein